MAPSSWTTRRRRASRRCRWANKPNVAKARASFEVRAFPTTSSNAPRFHRYIGAALVIARLPSLQTLPAFRLDS